MNHLPRHPRSHDERGAALITAVFAAFSTAVMVTVVYRLAVSSNRDAQSKTERVQALYLAEGAIEAAKNDLIEAIANWEDPPQNGTVFIDGVQLDYTITEAMATQAVADASGIQTLVTGYEIEARAVTAGASVAAHRMVNAEATPIFQFMVFYTNDLEILPGPNMTLGGRVHTNGDMYIGSGGTLTVDTNYLRAVGRISRNRKDAPSQTSGNVDVRRWVRNPFDASEPRVFERMYNEPQFDALGVPSTTGFDSSFTAGFDANGNGSFTDPGDWLPWGPGALERWSEPSGYADGTGHTVLTAAHGVTEAVTPSIESIVAFEAVSNGDYVYDVAAGEYVAVATGTGTHDRGYYHENADLKILLNPDGTLLATDGLDNDVTAAVSAAVTIDRIYDARLLQGVNTTIPTIRVDLQALAASGRFPANGLLYASAAVPGVGAAGSGLFLTNGAELSRSLTVVSEQSVYVQGDYNTVNKKGAAVIGDAVNLLSNSWSGAKTAGTLPSASNTTFNLAMITGNHETGTGRYNGGLENLPRFHENWNGRTCTIRGSLVNTWYSAYATGGWVYGGDRYTAPARNWNYETAFNSVANLPPFTPMVVVARDVVSW